MLARLWFHEDMRPLTIADAKGVVVGLQEEIRRSEESRYDHRLHGVLLVAQGMTCPQVARLLGDAPRTAQYWVRTFEKNGLAGLQEGERSGRPPRLSQEQLQGVSAALRQPPEQVGVSTNLWDGKSLAQFLQQRYGVELGVRQCQRLFRKLEFRLRKPRPEIARADPERQRLHKKNSGTG
jgi:transposase